MLGIGVDGRLRFPAVVSTPPTPMLTPVTTPFVFVRAPIKNPKELAVETATVLGRASNGDQETTAAFSGRASQRRCAKTKIAVSGLDRGIHMAADMW